jgi:hypothetical protein
MEGRARNFSRRHGGLRPSRVRPQAGRVRASGGERSGLQAARDAGFRPGGMRASGREGAGFGRVMLRRSSGRAATSDGWAAASAEEAAACAGLRLRSAGMWWALATDAAVSSRETRGLSAGDVAE